MKLLIIAMLISTGVYGQHNKYYQTLGLIKPKPFSIEVAKEPEIQIRTENNGDWVISYGAFIGYGVSHLDTAIGIYHNSYFLKVKGQDVMKDSIVIEGDTMQAIRKLLFIINSNNKTK